MANQPTLPNLPDSFSQPIPQRNTQGLVTSLQNQNGPARSDAVAAAVLALQHTNDGATATLTDARNYLGSLQSYLTSFASYVKSAISGVVTSVIAGAGIGVSSATGDVTITNTGVTSLVAGTAIGVSGSTGAVTVNNTGVTSIVAGTNITVSGATGAVTINSTASGGVTSLAAGTGIGVSSSTGAVTVSNTGVTSFNGGTGPVSGVSSVAASGGLTSSGGANPTIAPPGAWNTSWSPNPFVSGSWTTTGSISVSSNAYQQIGKMVMFRLKMTFTVATATGSGPWAINFTLPVTAITADQAFSGFQYNNTTNLPAFFYGGILASTSLGSAGINITTNDYTVWCSGVYEAN